MKFVCFALTLAACSSSDAPKNHVGDIVDAKVYMDARVIVDARPPDAKVFLDAQMFTRSCANKDKSLTNGTENLELAIVCSTSADALAAHATLADGSSMPNFTIVCLPGGAAANNFLSFPEPTTTTTVTKISTVAFDLDCN